MIKEWLVTEHTEQRRESAAMLGVYHWLTPVLIVTLGAVFGFIGSQWMKEQTRQTQSLTVIEVQLAQIQTDLTFDQATAAQIQRQLAALSSEQQNHEHRITVLEQERKYQHP